MTPASTEPESRGGHGRRAPAPPGTGRLGPGLVVGHAFGMARGRMGQVGTAAFVFFAAPAALLVGAEALHDVRAGAGATLRWVLLGAVVVVASIARVLGEIFFAGFLDLAIGDEYFRGRHRTVRDVLRALPWRPLLAVDAVVTAAAAVGAAFLVVPGLVVYTLFGLVGPVVVQERRGVRDALVRTVQVSVPHWPLVLGLVVVPLGIEHAVAEVVRHAVRDDGMLVVVGAEWLVAVTILAAVGVVEVALATELLARTPAPDAGAVEVAARNTDTGAPDHADRNAERDVGNARGAARSRLSPGSP
ncbi:MAG: hypothetical protein AMXMBFR46_27780 [Acidimicrobiia bacterium]